VSRPLTSHTRSVARTRAGQRGSKGAWRSTADWAPRAACARSRRRRQAPRLGACGASTDRIPPNSPRAARSMRPSRRNQPRLRRAPVAARLGRCAHSARRCRAPGPPRCSRAHYDDEIRRPSRSEIGERQAVGVARAGKIETRPEHARRGGQPHRGRCQRRCARPEIDPAVAIQIADRDRGGQVARGRRYRVRNGRARSDPRSRPRRYARRDQIAGAVRRGRGSDVARRRGQRARRAGACRASPG
jgi:hypothetical protein